MIQSHIKFAIKTLSLAEFNVLNPFSNVSLDRQNSYNSIFAVIFIEIFYSQRFRTIRSQIYIENKPKLFDIFIFISD